MWLKLLIAYLATVYIWAVILVIRLIQRRRPRMLLRARVMWRRIRRRRTIERTSPRPATAASS